MKAIGKIALGIFLIGLGLIVAGLIAGGAGVIPSYSGDDYTLVDESYSTAGIVNLNLDFRNKRIEVLPAEDDEIRIVYYVTEDHPVIVTEEDTSLTFIEESDWLFGWFDFTWFIPDDYFACTLYVPATAVLALDMSTSNGTIDIDGFTGLVTIDATTSNGQVTLGNIVTSGAISVVSSNGAIVTHDIVAGGDIMFRTSNGRITIDTLATTDDVVLKTSNGPVDVEGLVASGLEVDTSNGRIDVTMTGSYDDYKILMETSNGDMYINGVKRNDGAYNTDVAATIDLDTMNGDIHLDFTE
jgi:hypothetical protein